jgi:pimeloyl-ACP methyl ester carboxylesterase
VRPSELQDAGGLTATVLDELAVTTRDVHRAVAGRVFGLLDRGHVPVAPVRLLHDGIAALSYGAVRLGVTAVPPAAGFVTGALRGDDRTVHDSRAGRFALGALNGLFGDRMATDTGSLATRLSVRTHDGRRRTDPADLARDVAGSHPGPTGRVVVFLHGLCEQDDSWWFKAEQHWGDRDTTYGSLLRRDLGWTPLYLAYNTGLHVSANGVAVAGLLDELVRTWPVEVEELALVGHSMGGLVARSACCAGEAADHRWVGPLRHVFCLGTPHLGAPLERLVARGSAAMRRVPELRPFGRLLNQRSVGIKDLRYGSLVEADWRDVDLDEWLPDGCTDVPFLPEATYYYVGVTLTRSHEHPVAGLVGDLLVQFPSASGAGPTRRIPFEVDKGRHFGGLHHFDLLNNPDIYRQLHAWLAAAAP